MEDSANRITRKKALSMDEVVKLYIDSMKISSGLNTQRIFAAWDEVSGVSQFTLRKFFRDGILYITLSSSLVRNQVYLQLDELVRQVNLKIQADPLFTQSDPNVGLVKKIVLK